MATPDSEVAASEQVQGEQQAVGRGWTMRSLLSASPTVVPLLAAVGTCRFHVQHGGMKEAVNAPMPQIATTCRSTRCRRLPPYSTSAPSTAPMAVCPPLPGATCARRPDSPCGSVDCASLERAEILLCP